MRTIKEQDRLLSPRLLMLAVLLSPVFGHLWGQSLLLDDAYALLEGNYAVLQNAGLNDRILQTELDILDLQRKPSLYLKGAATLQSEVTKLEGAENLPISLDLPLYNVRAYGEINYSLHDGGRLAARKKVTRAEGELANQQLELERFALRERVNQLFLGVLLHRERVMLYETTLLDISVRKASIEAAVLEGVVLESELLQLQVREIEIKAERDNVQGQITRLLANLSTLIGQPLAQDVELRLPDLPALTVIPELNRPEFRLFDLQRAAILANDDLIDTDTRPVLSAFAQAGLGIPNPVNLFDNNISPYAIGGVNFQWKFKDWGKAQKQKEILELRVAQLQHQEETLRFNLNVGTEAYLADVQRLQDQITQDEQIVTLQAQILEQLAAQLDNGIITSADYLVQANAALKARQQLKIHETQLQQLQLNFLNNRGSF